MSNVWTSDDYVISSVDRVYSSESVSPTNVYVVKLQRFPISTYPEGTVVSINKAESLTLDGKTGDDFLSTLVPLVNAQLQAYDASFSGVVSSEETLSSPFISERLSFN